MKWSSSFKENQFLYIATLAMPLAFLTLSFILKEDTFIQLSAEDGFIEYIGAFCFLLSSILFFVIYRKSQDGNDFILFKTKKNIFFFLLALLFLICTLEEISWGQRIFNFSTPESLIEANHQQEFNFHNLNIFSPHDGFSLELVFRLFYFSFCLFVPLLVLFSSEFKKFMLKINLPLVPIIFGLLFLLNFVLVKGIGFYFDKDISAWNHGLVEARETNIAFIFLMISIFFFNKNNK